MSPDPVIGDEQEARRILVEAAYGKRPAPWYWRGKRPMTVGDTLSSVADTTPAGL